MYPTYAQHLSVLLHLAYFRMSVVTIAKKRNNQIIHLYPFFFKKKEHVTASSNVVCKSGIYENELLLDNGNFHFYEK